MAGSIPCWGVYPGQGMSENAADQCLSLPVSPFLSKSNKNTLGKTHMENTLHALPCAFQSPPETSGELRLTLLCVHRLGRRSFFRSFIYVPDSPRAHWAPPPSAPSSLPAQFVSSEVKGQHSQVLSFPRPHFTQSAPHSAGVSEPAPWPRFSIRRGVPADILSGRLLLGE